MSLSNTIGTTVADNYMKVKGSGHFGTRQFMHIMVWSDYDIETDYKEPNSVFAQLVRAIQQQAEVYEVTPPGPSFNSPYDYGFQMILAWDTTNSFESTYSIDFDGDYPSGPMADDMTSLSNPNVKILDDLFNDVMNYLGHTTSGGVALCFPLGDALVPAAPALTPELQAKLDAKLTPAQKDVFNKFKR